MRFIVVSRARVNALQEKIASRIDWQFPQGIKLIGEYWSQTGPVEAVSIVEAIDIALITDALAEWRDVFDMTVSLADSPGEDVEFPELFVLG